MNLKGDLKMRMYYNNCEIRELEIESLKGAFITDVEVDGDDVIIKVLISTL